MPLKVLAEAESRLGRAEQKGKNSFFPQPPSFLPACLGFALKFFERADGGVEIRKEE
jgi:hypothetical protein